MSEDPHTRGNGRAPMKRDIKFAATIVVLTTAMLSFTSLRDLASKCGFSWLSWVWPICLDAVAYLGTRVWLDKGSAWRFARGLSVSAVALSLVANGLVHGLGDIKPHWMIVVLVGAVPPLMLALVIHMLVANDSENLPVPVKSRSKAVAAKTPKKVTPKIDTIEQAPVTNDDSGNVSLTNEMQAAGWAPGDYTSAKAAMHGYLEKVDSSVTGADLEEVVGRFFKITPGAGAGRRAVREFKAAMAAASTGKG